MAEELEKCRICHNHIVEERKLRGADGTDENGDPLPFWSEDPLLTSLGLAGESFKGKNPMRALHIQELQEYYSDLEEQLLPEDELTSFTTVEYPVPIRHLHIEELRISVEKLLKASGYTKEVDGFEMADLLHYFKYTRLGEELPSVTQSDWTDVDRDNTNKLPLIPIATIKTLVKAIHIEELRIGIGFGWVEPWQKDYQSIDTYYKVKVDLGPGPFPHPVVEIDKDLPIFLTDEVAKKKWFVGNNDPGYQWLTTVNQQFSSWIEGDGYSKVEIVSGIGENKKVRLHTEGKNWTSDPWVPNYHWLRSLTAGISPIDLEIANPNAPWGYQFPSTMKITENLCYDFDFVFALPSGWEEINKVYGEVLTLNVRFMNGAKVNKGRLVYYLRTKNVTPDYKTEFAINCTSLIHFTRNLYDDYVAAYGVPTEDIFIRSTTLQSNLRFHTYNTDGIIYALTVDVDNIAFKGITEPDITVATQGSISPPGYWD